MSTLPHSRVIALWHVDSLPFVMGALDRPHNISGLPDALPFVLGVDTRTGLVSQGQNLAVADALGIAYRTADAMPSNFDASGIGRIYADDFLAFIDREIGEFKGRRVLEIGSGTGYLLGQLRDRGGVVLGIEPGAHGQDGAREIGVEIVHDFFPSPEVTGLFDFIVLSNVLEHLEDPVDFLGVIASQLAIGGRIIIGVPDESAYINSGDASTLFHEHWSYFDRRTLTNTVRMAGLNVDVLETASFGGSLYCVITPVEQPVELVEVPEALELAERYARQMQAQSALIREFVEDSTRDGRGLGVYVPSRFVNVAKIAGLRLDAVRFFDDDESAHGKFYPGFVAPIENREELLAQPPVSVLIMSQTFGPRLAQTLAGLLPGVRITCVADVLALNSSH
ncbi:MAG: class I SAM-dependent methyltransferase [Pseudolysinimonas sp.]|uniref:class I SAM-dependent methyltransferase n=1 Tax=Pseudolysinimonas sp. TaxID=2680009 RepID=UPI003266F6AC